MRIAHGIDRLADQLATASRHLEGISERTRPSSGSWVGLWRFLWVALPLGALSVAVVLSAGLLSYTTSNLADPDAYDAAAARCLQEEYKPLALVPVGTIAASLKAAREHQIVVEKVAELLSGDGASPGSSIVAEFVDDVKSIVEISESGFARYAVVLLADGVGCRELMKDRKHGGLSKKGEAIK